MCHFYKRDWIQRETIYNDDHNNKCNKQNKTIYTILI